MTTNNRMGYLAALLVIAALIGGFSTFEGVPTSEEQTVKGLTVTDLTASRPVAASAAKALESTTAATWVDGTASEITVADDGDGSITIGLDDPVAVTKGGTGNATLSENAIPYGSAANTFGEITPAASSVLVTNGSNVPSLGTDIPTAVTIGSGYIYRGGGTDVSLADGGTGESLANGSAGQVLQSDGDGTTSWTSNWVGTAPGDLDMSTYSVLNVGDGTETAPSGGLSFGDGDSGFYESADDALECSASSMSIAAQALDLSGISAGGDATLTITSTDDDAADAGTLVLASEDTSAGARHSGDTIGEVQFKGMGASAMKTGAAIKAVASENFTDADFGTDLEFYTADDGTSTLTKRMTLTDSGSLYLASSNTFQTTTGILTVAGATALNLYAYNGGISLSGKNYVFGLTDDRPAGDYALMNSTNEDRSFTDTNGEQSWLHLDGDIEQSGTAAYNGLLIAMDEDSLGDGTTGTCGDNSLICAGTDTDPDMFAVIHDGTIKQTVGALIVADVDVSCNDADDTCAYTSATVQHWITAGTDATGDTLTVEACAAATSGKTQTFTQVAGTDDILIDVPTGTDSTLADTGDSVTYRCSATDTTWYAIASNGL